MKKNLIKFEKVHANPNTNKEYYVISTSTTADFVYCPDGGNYKYGILIYNDLGEKTSEKFSDKLENVIRLDKGLDFDFAFKELEDDEPDVKKCHMDLDKSTEYFATLENEWEISKDDSPKKQQEIENDVKDYTGYTAEELDL